MPRQRSRQASGEIVIAASAILFAVSVTRLLSAESIRKTLDRVWQIAGAWFLRVMPDREVCGSGGLHPVFDGHWHRVRLRRLPDPGELITTRCGQVGEVVYGRPSRPPPTWDSDLRTWDSPGVNVGLAALGVGLACMNGGHVCMGGKLAGSRVVGMESVRAIERWPVDNAATAVVSAAGDVLGQHGDTRRVFGLASVSKPLTAYAALIAIEEGVVELDTPAGPEGSTVRHLLAHTSGLAFDAHKAMAPPGTRRLYSNAGFEVLADTLAEHSGIPFAEYQAEALFGPLGMVSSKLEGSPASGAVSSVDDLIAFATELQEPKLLDPQTLHEATSVVFPGLSGVLPGFGHQKPNDWGLGFELRDHKSPHWTGAHSSPATFGHFGQSGTFLWVDPVAKAACIALTDRAFGPWAAENWPPYTDAVLAELSA
jgi:hypothetical protein